MKASSIILLAMLVIITLAGAAQAAQLPIEINDVKVDGVSLSPDQTTRLSIERGQKLNVEILITAFADVSDVEAEVFMSGFEYNKWERAGDITGPKNLAANTQYKFKFQVPISSDFEKDGYKLRVLVSNRDHDEIMQNYNLNIDVPRHSLRINDVIFYPENTVKAGSALLASVRIENKGEMKEKDVKVTVKIPNLGVSATGYINEIKDNDDEEETEELFLKIPQCAKAGLYEVEITAYFSKKHYEEKTTHKIYVTENPLCEENENTQPKTTITIGSQMESMPQGGSAVYPITITNSGKERKSYTLTTDSPTWADIRITPSSTVMLESGKTQTMYIFLDADKKAPQGAQVFTATISSSGEQLEQVALTANITKKQSNALKTILEVMLVLLVALLVIIGLIIGFSKLRRNNEEPEDDLQTEAYY